MTHNETNQERLERFKSVLKQKGLKATPQRLAVHSVMLELGHACADMVVEKLKESDNKTVTTASVYNILTQMAELGIYTRRLSSNNKMYFDVNTFHHIHLYDRVNNEYQDVVDPEILSIIESQFKGKRFRGYSVEGVDVQLICRPTKRH